MMVRDGTAKISLEATPLPIWPPINTAGQDDQHRMGDACDLHEIKWHDHLGIDS